MRILPSFICSAVFSCAALIFLPRPARCDSMTEPYAASRETLHLFQEEIQECDAKLKWRGERLTDDTIYAAALTGLSWEPAWGKEHVFSLAWGDLRKAAPLRHRTKAQAAELMAAVLNRAASGGYAEAVKIADADFSAEEIGCNPALKEAVGKSLLALNRPEQACAVYAAPFDPAQCADAADADRAFRQAAFESAERAAQQSDRFRRVAIAFALSLALDPETPDALPNENAIAYLKNHGVEMERVLLGILEAPEHLRGLPAYAYAAADLLTWSAAPRLLPFLMHLAQCDDVYLRSRALIGLGVLAYQSRPKDTPNGMRRLISISMPLTEYGLSVGERKIILREAVEAAGSDKYRLRAAAAVTLALMGDEADAPLLQKLAKDHAYLLSPAPKDSKNAPRHIVFPVRQAAAAGLARFGVRVPAADFVLSGKALEQAKRGGQDATNDRRNRRKTMYGLLAISPLDVLPDSLAAQ